MVVKKMVVSIIHDYLPILDRHPPKHQSGDLSHSGNSFAFPLAYITGMSPAFLRAISMIFNNPYIHIMI
jgi:hypothetical protein